MAQIRVFTDEDVYGAVAPALRKARLDAISTPEAERVLLTFNVDHFANLHAEWMRRGRNHAGIVISVQRSIGDVLRRLLHLTAMLDSDAMVDRLEFLSDW